MKTTTLHNKTKRPLSVAGVALSPLGSAEGKAGVDYRKNLFVRCGWVTLEIADPEADPPQIAAPAVAEPIAVPAKAAKPVAKKASKKSRSKKQPKEFSPEKEN